LKLKVVGVEGGRLEMQLSGEGHTLLNLLQSSLLADEDVRMARWKSSSASSVMKSRKRQAEMRQT